MVILIIIVFNFCLTLERDNFFQCETFFYREAFSFSPRLLLLTWGFFFCRETFSFLLRWDNFFNRESFPFEVRLFFWCDTFSFPMRLFLLQLDFFSCRETFYFCMRLFLLHVRMFLQKIILPKVNITVQP